MCTESLQSRLALCDPVDLAHQAPLSMRFSRQEHWSGMQCVPPGGLSNPGIKPSLMSPVLTGRFFVTSATWEAPWVNYLSTITHSEPGFQPNSFSYCYSHFLNVLFLFWPHHTAWQTLVLQPVLKPAPPALEAQNLSR